MFAPELHLDAQRTDLLIKIAGLSSKIHYAVDSATGLTCQAHMAKVDHRQNNAPEPEIQGTDQRSRSE